MRLVVRVHHVDEVSTALAGTTFSGHLKLKYRDCRMRTHSTSVLTGANKRTSFDNNGERQRESEKSLPTSVRVNNYFFTFYLSLKNEEERLLNKFSISIQKDRWFLKSAKLATVTIPTALVEMDRQVSASFPMERPDGGGVVATVKLSMHIEEEVVLQHVLRPVIPPAPMPTVNRPRAGSTTEVIPPRPTPNVTQLINKAAAEKEVPLILPQHGENTSSSASPVSPRSGSPAPTTTRPIAAVTAAVQRAAPPILRKSESSTSSLAYSSQPTPTSPLHFNPPVKAGPYAVVKLRDDERFNTISILPDQLYGSQLQLTSPITTGDDEVLL